MGSCFPWLAPLPQVLCAARRREARVSGCAGAGSGSAPAPQQDKTPTRAPGHVSPHSSPALLRALPAQPRLPEPGRAGETQALAAGTGTESSCRRPHSTAPTTPLNKSLLGTPSLAHTLSGSPGTSQAGPGSDGAPR